MRARITIVNNKKTNVPPKMLPEKKHRNRKEHWQYSTEENGVLSNKFQLINFLNRNPSLRYGELQLNGYTIIILRFSVSLKLIILSLNNSFDFV